MNLPATIIAACALLWAAALLVGAVWFLDFIAPYAIPALYTVVTFDGLIEAAQ